jgi:hypothetical protein
VPLPTALFVAREPDETLRTYLPVLACLRQRGRCAPRVLFHHAPERWARAELARLGVEWREVALPPRALPAGPLGALARTPLAPTLAELAQLRAAGALARRLLAELRPSVVVVIQDTLLLERFLVRAANRRGVPTLVVQWAFTYPQEYYDRFHARAGAPRRGARAVIGRATAAGYRAALAALDVGFRLANSYGGGEAAYMAVMGEAFEAQFRAQGARKHAFFVTGHPSHDAAFARVRAWRDEERAAVLRELGLPLQTRLITYATQPALWRGVLTRAQLRETVETVAAGVQSQGADYALVVKLHPREDPAEYAFLEDRPRVRVVKAVDVQRLIAASEAFVSASSSTLLYAMMYERPIVTINFYGVPHYDFFAPLGGTLHIRSPDAFAAALGRALRDPETRERLRREQRSVLERYTRFDGKATERLADLIEGWATGRGR